MEIEFKAQQVDNKEWVYGYYVCKEFDTTVWRNWQ